MSFFTDPEILLGDKLLEILYIIMGLVLIYTGIRNINDKTNPHRYGSAFFWTVLGIVIAGGRWLPAIVNGLFDFCHDSSSDCKESQQRRKSLTF